MIKKSLLPFYSQSFGSIAFPCSNAFGHCTFHWKCKNSVNVIWHNQK